MQFKPSSIPSSSFGVFAVIAVSAGCGASSMEIDLAPTEVKICSKSLTEISFNVSGVLNGISTATFEWYLDDSHVGTTEWGQQFPLNLTNLADAIYTLTVDGSGDGGAAASQSATVTIHNKPISASLSSVLAGDTVLTATVIDSIGIAKVEFYLNDTLVGEDTTAPYEFTLSTALVSGDAVYAIAYSTVHVENDECGRDNLPTGTGVTKIQTNVVTVL